MEEYIDNVENGKFYYQINYVYVMIFLQGQKYAQYKNKKKINKKEEK